MMQIYKQEKDCCACWACMNICPKNAIEMKSNQYGFLYPVIDHEQCINCGACKKVCAYQVSEVRNRPIQAYAAVNKSIEQLMKSASGGVFSALASKILEREGVVFGATLEFLDGHAMPHHIVVENVEQLPALQGSKYVQSAIGNTYKQAKEFLKNGKNVLFSGTPCQIDGLYGYLGKDYDNLITVDVICHGVPNAQFFDDYLQNEKAKKNAQEVCGYTFRDKKKGWGMNSRLDLQYHDQMVKSVHIPARLASYNTFFLDGDIYRENCYFCKYAGELRPSDLTIGDYWGIEIEHPELLKKKEFQERYGISCILANTTKGVRVCESLNGIYKEVSSFEKVSNRNKQLKHPSLLSPKRETILRLYAEQGYEALDAWFYRNYKKQIILHTVFNMVPRGLQMRLKKILKN